jgi:Glyoxalase-like domain
MSQIAWVQAFIDVPNADVARTQAFWAAATGHRISRPWTDHPEFVSLVPPNGNPYVHVQQIGTGPRVHIDLTTDDVEAEADRLSSLGAGRGERFPWWQVMSSPGGLPFCLCSDAGRERPGPVQWPAGHRSRVTNVSIDAPATLHDAELRFWEGATGWPRSTANVPDFDVLRPQSTSPVGLLVQRLGADDPRTTVTAHLDIGTDQVAAEVARLVEIGAVRLGPPFNDASWIVLRDPAGLPFCVTVQRPD